MFRFARPEYLYLLALVPVLIGFFYYALIIKSKRLKTLGNKALLRTLMPEASHIRPRVKFYLLLTAFILSVFMMAGPQFGSKLEKQKRQGVELKLSTKGKDKLQLIETVKQAINVQQTRVNRQPTTHGIRQPKTF